MSKNEEEITLKQEIVKINEALDEIRKEQKNQREIIEKNHETNMKKFSKLLEYNEITDTTSKVFEKRIANIESLLYEVFKS